MATLPKRLQQPRFMLRLHMGRLFYTCQGCTHQCEHVAQMMRSSFITPGDDHGMLGALPLEDPAPGGLPLARDPAARTAAQGETLAPWLPAGHASPRGGPQPLPTRSGLAGLLWRLRAGARGHARPQGVPAPSPWRRRRREGQAHGVGLTAWRGSCAALDAPGHRDGSAACADGSVAPAHTGALGWGRPHATRARRGWGWSPAEGCLWAPSWPRRPPPR
jgi:hypothetical protein